MSAESRAIARQTVACNEDMITAVVDRVEVWRQCLEIEHDVEMLNNDAERRLLQLGILFGIASLNELLAEAELELIPREWLSGNNNPLNDLP